MVALASHGRRRSGPVIFPTGILKGDLARAHVVRTVLATANGTTLAPLTVYPYLDGLRTLENPCLCLAICVVIPHGPLTAPIFDPLQLAVGYRCGDNKGCGVFSVQEHD